MQFQITEEEFAENLHNWLGSTFGGSIIVEVETEYGKAYVIDETEYRILRNDFITQKFGKKDDNK